MKGGAITSVCDQKGTLLATAIATHGRNEIQILPLHDEFAPFKSNIEFQADEAVEAIQWIPQSRQRVNGKRGRDSRQSAAGSVVYSYLAILLKSGEILVYSPLTKEFTNKISNESPLSCICYGGSASTILGFDPLNSCLKKYNLFDSRPLGTTTVKLDSGVRFLQSINDRELVLASATVHLYNEEEEAEVFSVGPQQGHHNQIRHIVIHDGYIAVSRLNDATINIIELSSAVLLTTLAVSESTVKTISWDPADQLLFAVRDDGKVEVFVDPFTPTRQRKDIKSNSVIEAATGTISDLVVDPEGHYKAVFFDSFQVKVKSLQFTGLADATGTIEVSLDQNDSANGAATVAATSDDPGADAEDRDMADNEEESENEAVVDGNRADKDESGDNDDDDESDDDDDDDEIDETDLPEIDSAFQLYKEIEKNRENDRILFPLLAVNTEFSRETVYELNDAESGDLFKKCAMEVCEQSKYASGLSQWTKWLLLVKGSLLVKDSENVELLRLLRATLKENIKILPNLLSLQGRLALLESQLELRAEIQAERPSEDDDEDDNEVDGLLNGKNVESSVVMDGENDNDEDGIADYNDEDEDDL